MKPKKPYNLHLFALLSILLFVGISCYKDSDYLASSLVPKTLFQLSGFPDSVPADGFSKMSISVSGLPVNTDDTSNSAVFITDYGSFISNSTNTTTVAWTYEYLSNGSLVRIASVPLKGTILPDSAHVSAKINGVTVTRSLYFFRAYPDILFIMPSTVYINSMDTAGIGIEVDMFRYSGTTSFGTMLNLTITDTSGNSVGAFSKYRNLSDSSGKCYFQYYFMNPTYIGRLLVTAQIANISQPLIDTTSINVIQ